MHNATRGASVAQAALQAQALPPRRLCLPSTTTSALRSSHFQPRDSRSQCFVATAARPVVTRHRRLAARRPRAQSGGSRNLLPSQRRRARAGRRHGASLRRDCSSSPGP
eukprot:scaffold2378_cov424-Prasinococcus_capsulatus_cf.AAC.7